jgi:Lar family restriction alleviation protein
MIKPCPFCGNEVALEKLPLWRTYNDGTTHGYYGSYEYNIHCEKCGCRINLRNNDTVYNSEEEAKQNAINAWNRRKEKENG